MNQLRIVFGVSVVALLISVTPVISVESKGVWELWVVPAKYTINQGERIKLTFGLTGYGNIDQTKIKIIAHSEEDTLIQYGEDKSQYDTYAIAPNKTSPPNRFTNQDERAKDTIITVSDYNSGFGQLFLTPKSSGNKKFTLYATFFIQDDGWHSARYDFEYHVNTWTEEHQTGITIASIILGLLSISFLPSVGMRLLDRCRNNSDNRGHFSNAKRGKK
ncbi:MAG: hypothetical protein WA974_00230 [Thermodesulfobacteriota bacterium]